LSYSIAVFFSSPIWPRNQSQLLCAKPHFELGRAFFFVIMIWFFVLLDSTSERDSCLQVHLLLFFILFDRLEEDGNMCT
jgi:hypothetical protein